MTILDSWAPAVPAVGLATVIGTTGSTPRPVGARLVVAPDGRMGGSISGGCLEADVVEEVLRTLSGVAPPRLLHYGISDELGWSVGLACGGEVDVFVERLRWSLDDPVVAALRDGVAQGQAVAICTTLEGQSAGSHLVATAEQLVGDPSPFGGAAELREMANSRLSSGVAGIDQLPTGATFIQPLVPPPKLVIVGAVDVASVLSGLAKSLGYQVIVIDPRERFCTRERFPLADQLVVAWPQGALAGIPLGPRDAAVCLTHDPKFDDPTLASLMAGAVGYIGAVGSSRTQAARRERLALAGASTADLARIHGPVGLDLGAASPREMALEILAELVGARNQRTGGPRSSATQL
ncbi:MAG: XdhC family protein [Candidatus Dormibacteria bacterium]